jgi:YHS domain-containing protein
MFRFLWLFFLFLLSYYLVTALSGLFKAGGHHPPPEKRPEGEAMIRDPYCGTFVPRSLAIKKTVKGKTCYFCSEECMNKYIQQKTSDN